MLTLILIPALLAPDGAEALARFKKAYKSREVTQRAAAVAELGKTDDRKVRSRLRKLLTADLPPVRIAAAKGLGATAEDPKGAARYLAGAIRGNSKNPNVVIAIFEALGKLQEESVVGEVHRCFQMKEVAVAKAAVGASGRIKSVRSIPILIDLLRKMEEIEKKPASGDLPGGGGLPGGFGGDIPGVGRRLPGGVIEGARDNSDRRRAQVVGPAVRQALQEITRAIEADSRAWQVWWAKNRRSFKPQK